MTTFGPMIRGTIDEMQINIPDGVPVHICLHYPDDVKSFKAIGGTYTVTGTKTAIVDGVYTLWYVKQFTDERTKLVNGELVTYDTWFVDAQDIPTPPRKINTI